MAEPRRRRGTDRPPEQLSEQALAARRKYQRNYRRANPEKVAAWNRRYWERQGASYRVEAGHDAEEVCED